MDSIVRVNDTTSVAYIDTLINKTRLAPVIKVLTSDLAIHFCPIPSIPYNLYPLMMDEDGHLFTVKEPIGTFGQPYKDKPLKSMNEAVILQSRYNFDHGVTHIFGMSVVPDVGEVADYLMEQRNKK